MPEKIDTGYELVVIKGDDRGRSFPLCYREIHIGRKSQPDATDVDWVFLVDATVSRHHASLVWDDHRHRYILHHRSRTNPTVVNGQAVIQEELGPSDTVQLGMLTFRVSRRDQAHTMAAHNLVLPRVVHEDKGRSDSGFTLTVTEGPDRGRTWNLDQPVVIIGCQQGGSVGGRAKIIPLQDSSLPAEQCMLTWQERERTYGIIQMDRSAVPTWVHRSGGTAGPEQVVLDSMNQILLQGEDLIGMGHTAMVLQQVRQSRDSGIRRNIQQPMPTPSLVQPQPSRPAPAAPEPRYPTPTEPRYPAQEVYTEPYQPPGAPRYLSNNPAHYPSPDTYSGGHPPSPRLPQAPASPPPGPPPGPPSGPPSRDSVGDRFMSRAAGGGTPPRYVPPPMEAPPPEVPGNVLPGAMWLRLSGDSAAAAQSYNDPYPAAYAGGGGWQPPPVSELSGGPNGYPGAWAQHPSQLRPQYPNQGPQFTPNSMPISQEVGPAPVQTPAWAEPVSSGEQEHEYRDNAYDNPSLPNAAVLRKAASGLWSRSRPPTAEVLPDVAPVERMPRSTADDDFRRSREESLPPVRYEDERTPVKSSRVKPEPEESWEEEERPAPRRASRQDVLDATRARAAQYEALIEMSDADESQSRPAPPNLPWGKTAAARRQQSEGERPPERGRATSDLDRPGRRGESERSKKVIGEPVRPAAPPARRDLLGEDFGARVVNPPGREDENGARPLEAWSPGGERASGVIKKGNSGGAAGPKPINIIGLGKSSGRGANRSPVRFQPPDDEDDSVQKLTATGGGWRFEADYVLGFIEGPLRGAKIELLTGDLAEGQEITIGRRGNRQNDIEINDERMANAQALLLFHEYHFTLVNEASHRPIQVNSMTVAGGEEMLLRHGDHIVLGNNRLIFLERSTVEALFGFELAIVNGVPQDRGRCFDIIRERTSIGRGEADITPSDEGVSRRHATVIYRKGAFFLLHESTSSPTFVNGVSLPKGRERQLNLGDKIQISKATTLVFREKN